MNDEEIDQAQLLEEVRSLRCRVAELEEREASGMNRRGTDFRFSSAHQFLHDVSRLAGIGVWQLDVSTQQQLWTREMFHIYDLNDSQPPGLDAVFDLYSDHSRSLLKQAFADALEKQQSFTLELEMTTVGGGAKWVKSTGEAVVEDGKVVLLQGTLQDISETKKFEESVQLAQLIFDKAPVGIWRLDENANIVDVNEKGCSSLGYTHDELCQMQIFDFDPQFTMQHWRDSFKAVKKEGSISLESIHQRKNGECFPIRVLENLIEFKGQIFRVTFVEDISHRKQIEDSLYLAQSIIDNTNIGIYQLSKSGCIISVNPKAADLLGYSRSELEGMFIGDIDVGPNPNGFNWQKLSLQKNRNLERLHRKKDGSVIPVEIASNLLKFGGQEYAIAFVQDISRRKKNEDAIREKDRLLQDIGQRVKVGAWKYDVGTGEVFSTDEVSRIYDFDRPRNISVKAGMSCFNGGYREQLENAFSAAIEQGVPYELELEMISSKGVHKWVRTSGHPVIENNQIVCIQGSIQDVTHIKQAELHIKESENRYRSLIELSPLGIGVIDVNGNIIDVNQAYASMFGYRIPELLKLHFRDLSHPDDFDREQELMTSLSNGEQADFSMEKRHKHQDGHYFWTHVTVGKACDIYGPGEFYFGFLSDISEQKALEDERNKLIDELKNALAEIKELNGYLPICSKCKKIRDDEGYWQQVEKYIMDRTDALFSHSYCPECYESELKKIIKS